ncbi:MAG: type II toxin-antitoxin system VapC family toxin [Rubrobacter sp.]|nr:type II toxin-antitoxin system VapC family toxin [Rubrobacter sp.]
MRAVLDASAVLAYLQDEPGAEVVEAALNDGACVSAANWAEVLSKLAELDQDPDEVAERFKQEGVLGEGLVVYPLDEAQARRVARLRPTTRSTGLSLADRACLALATSLDLPALTADRAWAELPSPLTTSVMLIR